MDTEKWWVTGYLLVSLAAVPCPVPRFKHWPTDPRSLQREMGNVWLSGFPKKFGRNCLSVLEWYQSKIAMRMTHHSLRGIKHARPAKKRRGLIRWPPDRIFCAAKVARLEVRCCKPTGCVPFFGRPPFVCVVLKGHQD